MSKLGKLRKNAENFAINDVYKNMTPEQYRNAVKYAVEKTKNDLIKEFEIKYTKLQNKFTNDLKGMTGNIIDTISVELLYELANQMGYWELKEETEEEKYIKESVKYRIQEIYTNTIDSIKKYGKMKRGSQAVRTFEKKKSKIEKEFDIKF
jgi:hypothetical protein